MRYIELYRDIYIYICSVKRQDIIHPERSAVITRGGPGRSPACTTCKTDDVSKSEANAGSARHPVLYIVCQTNVQRWEVSEKDSCTTSNTTEIDLFLECSGLGRDGEFQSYR